MMKSLYQKKLDLIHEVDRGSMAIAASGGDDFKSKDGVANILRYFNWYSSHYSFSKKETTNGND